jgi:predicted secreted Zn-dependent protease
MSIVKCIVDRIELALSTQSTLPSTSKNRATDLCKRPTRVVDGLDKLRVRHTDRLGTKPNDISVPGMELLLRFDVRLRIVIPKPPEIREAREKRTRQLLQRRAQVSMHILRDEHNSGGNAADDKQGHEGHFFRTSELRV